MAASLDEVERRSSELVELLQRRPTSQEVLEAKHHLRLLRDVRGFHEMAHLAEAVSRHGPADAQVRRLYAQSLIETGKVSVAIDVLQAVAPTVGKSDPEFEEVNGLLGRAFKQLFFDLADKSSKDAVKALEDAIDVYSRSYEGGDRKNKWLGVNVLALQRRAHQLGVTKDSADSRLLAKAIVADLLRVPVKERDCWYHATLAEAYLGLDDLQQAEAHFGAYVVAPDVTPFQVASTLRQLTDIWNIQELNDRGRGVVASLRARLLQLQGVDLQVESSSLPHWRAEREPSRDQLETILGPNGPQTYKWWSMGLARASGVASVKRRLGSRIGTGFLVRANDLGLKPADELLLLTNFHVVNASGAVGALTPASAEVIFEAVEPNVAYRVKEVVWSSPVDRHDAAALRLDPPVEGIEPMALSPQLPVVGPYARVFIIGHPGGRDLSFSFQDNELLDHEGPPAGKPKIADVCRVHYRAPTEGGSSGSPVFDANLWEVVGLHHKGSSKSGMSKLNGQTGYYGANEGISLLSIQAAIANG